LVVSGDISMACPPCQAARVEGPSMAQGQGTGGLSIPFMAWDNPGLNKHNESTQ